MSADRTYVMAVLVAVSAPSAELAYSAVNNPEDPNHVSAEAVFCSAPRLATREMVEDPDFGIPTITYGVDVLTPTTEDY